MKNETDIFDIQEKLLEFNNELKKNEEKKDELEKKIILLKNEQIDKKNELIEVKANIARVKKDIDQYTKREEMIETNKISHQNEDLIYIPLKRTELLVIIKELNYMENASVNELEKDLLLTFPLLKEVFEKTLSNKQLAVIYFNCVCNMPIKTIGSILQLSPSRVTQIYTSAKRNLSHPKVLKMISKSAKEKLENIK